MRLNVVFIMADDQAAHAIGAHGSRLNATRGIDRIAQEGMRFDACFCTNSPCSPSRAASLTGTYNHLNGETSNSSRFDGRQQTFVKLLRDAGYQTGIFGKWHPYASVVRELTEQLRRLKAEVGDTDCAPVPPTRDS